MYSVALTRLSALINPRVISENQILKLSSQWIGLGAFTAVAQVRYLVGELRSRKPRGVTKNKIKTKKTKQPTEKIYLGECWRAGWIASPTELRLTYSIPRTLGGRHPTCQLRLILQTPRGFGKLEWRTRQRHLPSLIRISTHPPRFREAGERSPFWLPQPPSPS